jgi:hypothetical protein
MEDLFVSVFKNHVVSYVPDFQTKPADSQPTRRVLICRFKNGGGVSVLMYLNCFLVPLKIHLYHSSQSQSSILHQNTRYRYGSNIQVPIHQASPDHLVREVIC